MATPDAQAIDALLPQTQCGECSYPGCKPYAEALAHGQATIDRCPPGGVQTLIALGALLNIDPEPYQAAVQQATRPPQRAVIREAECIGCVKCVPACPVDAIIGSAKQLHTVLSHECTGCGLCIEPCPVDCIDLIEEPEENYDRKNIRLLREAQEKERRYREKRQMAAHANDPTEQDKTAKNAYILAAMARSRAKKT